MMKGEATRSRILHRAFRLAGRDGLKGVTFGTLAGELAMSKSGLFAHFASKDELQIETLKTAAEHFVQTVLSPAFQAPRGLPRIQRLFRNWVAWINDLPGGCIFMGAAMELDDRPGAPRDFLVATQTDLRATLAKTVHIAVESGQFRADLDTGQFVFELMGVLFSYHQARRLLKDKKAGDRAEAAFKRLVEAARA